MICRISCFYIYFLFISFIFCVGWKGLNGITIKHAVHRFFQYFKPDNPIGIPAIDLEDPLEIITPLETVPVTLYNGKVFGVSNIKIENVFLNFLSLTGSIKITAPRLEINGQYKWPSLFAVSDGIMNATLMNITIGGDFSMFITRNFSLQVSNLELNETSDEVYLNLTNLVWAHQLVVDSGVVNIFFDDIVAEFFRQVQPILLDRINQEISKFMSSLPPVQYFLSSEKDSSSSSSSSSSSLSPPSLSSEKLKSESFTPLLNRLLLLIGMEPLNLPDKNTNVIGVNFKVEELVLHGASNVSKVESLNIIYKDKKVYIAAAMTYPKLLLFYKIKMSTGSSINMDFYEKNQLNNVYINIRIVVDLQLKQPASVRYLDIHVGSFGKLRDRKKKSFWGKIVGAFTDFKDLILREIVNALQGTIQKTVQKKLNSTDIENGLVVLLERVFINN
ncbi:UNVERIFIED_CONTAM: hypothetical protein RMT77_001265 [Armadillidium vulgare]